jgi:hypothetical protein
VGDNIHWTNVVFVGGTSQHHLSPNGRDLTVKRSAIKPLFKLEDRSCCREKIEVGDLDGKVRLSFVERMDLNKIIYQVAFLQVLCQFTQYVLRGVAMYGNLNLPY